MLNAPESHLNGIKALLNGIKTRKKGQKMAFLWGKKRYFFDELTPSSTNKHRRIITRQRNPNQPQTHAPQGLQLYRGKGVSIPPDPIELRTAALGTFLRARNKDFFSVRF
ncbi:hypothetical protein LEC33_01050 [Salmonella enterica]|nr:hypothetical protein [Salmonella enterica]MDJ6850166.1 hypothetical protein [Salmonella enterica]MDJ7334219.1 hypothetical protein [Salmonella enterica]